MLLECAVSPGPGNDVPTSMTERTPENERRRHGYCSAARRRLTAEAARVHKIRVDVSANYLEDQSEPDEGRYVFAYTITIRNEARCRRGCSRATG